MLTISMLLGSFFLPGVVAHYCADKPAGLSISSTKNIEALNGSCLDIPCNFDTDDIRFNSSRIINGVWMKKNLDFGSSPNVVIFNSSGSVNTHSLKLTGNLTEKNCTTLFPILDKSLTDRYFFRIENEAFKATACADPIQINVKDSPWIPSIDIPVGDLKEHQSVTMICSALTPCPHSPPELTWNLQQDSHRKTEKNTDGTFTTKIQETITLSDTHDGYNISCSATYPVEGGNKTAETEVTLSVSYAPKDTSASISPSGLISAGSWVELSCSSRAKPPPSFTWFRNSKHGAINVSVGQVYSFNATEGGEYYCEATNVLGMEKSLMIHLQIKDLVCVAIPAGAIAAICIIACLVVSVWCFRSKGPTQQQLQSQRRVEVDLQMSGSETKEELHYGEVSIFTKKPEVFSISVQETVYAQVTVSKAENPSTQTDGNLDDLYSQVKKE